MKINWNSFIIISFTVVREIIAVAVVVVVVIVVVVVVVVVVNVVVVVVVGVVVVVVVGLSAGVSSNKIIVKAPLDLITRPAAEADYLNEPSLSLRKIKPVGVSLSL